MKLKVFGLAVVSALALMAFASTASATTLEVGGVAKNAAVTIEATLASGGSSLLTDTNNISANTWTVSTLVWDTTSSFTGVEVGGPITALSLTAGTKGAATVDSAGTLSIANIAGTTNGTVRSNGLKLTVPSAFGNLTCTTSNTDIGQLNGVKSGSATLTINAVLSCTIISTSKWTGTYTITSPVGLGVTS